MDCYLEAEQNLTVATLVYSFTFQGFNEPINFFTEGFIQKAYFLAPLSLIQILD